MVFGNTLSQRFGSDRRYTICNSSGKNTQDSLISGSKDDDWIKVWTWAFERKDHLHVNVQRHWSGKTRKQRTLYCECSQSYWVCSKIHARTLVVSGALIREEMLRNPCQQIWWRTGKTAEGMMLNFAENGHLVFRASNTSQGGELKSKGKGVKSIHFNGSDDSNYFRQSAQCLRSRFVEN